MAGFLDFLGGAASSVADTVTRDRELQQMEAFQNRLRQQEMQDQIKKDKIRAQLEQQNEQNRIRSIEVDPVSGRQYNVTAAGYQEGGIVPEGILSARRAEADAAKAERDLELGYLSARTEKTRNDIVQSTRKADAALISANRPRGGGRSERPPGPRDLAFMEDRAMRDAALAEGFERTGSGQLVKVDPSDPNSRVIATPEERARIERRAKAMLGRQSEATTSFDADSFLSQFQ